MKKNILNPYTEKITNGISVFTCCKNRAENLEKALQTWIKHKEIDEIVICDWGSDESLKPMVDKYQNGKIKLAIATNQPKWILSHAYNLSARMTSYNKIFKIDSDIKINDGFFDKHKLKSGIYYAGNWEKAKDPNQVHLNGMNYINRSDYFKVNGYNEFIKMYGWDDDDFYTRLCDSGLKRVDLDLDTLYHIPHDNRFSNQVKTHLDTSYIDKQRAKIFIAVNRYLTSIIEEWGQRYEMMNFDVSALDENTFICKQKEQDLNVATEDQLNKAKLEAIKEYLWVNKDRIPYEFTQQLNDEELFLLLNLYFDEKTNSENQTLFKLFAAVEAFKPDHTEKIKEIYNSYSWRIGHRIVKIIEFFLKILHINYNKNKGKS